MSNSDKKQQFKNNSNVELTKKTHILALLYKLSGVINRPVYLEGFLSAGYKLMLLVPGRNNNGEEGGSNQHICLSIRYYLRYGLRTCAVYVEVYQTVFLNS
jgi:hypothetical protein